MKTSPALESQRLCLASPHAARSQRDVPTARGARDRGLSAPDLVGEGLKSATPLAVRRFEPLAVDLPRATTSGRRDGDSQGSRVRHDGLAVRMKAGSDGPIREPVGPQQPFELVTTKEFRRTLSRPCSEVDIPVSKHRVGVLKRDPTRGR